MPRNDFLKRALRVLASPSPPPPAGSPASPAGDVAADADAALPPAAALRAELGFPPCRRADPPRPLTSGFRAVPAVGVAPLPVSFEDREGASMVTVCTRNYLYFARTAIGSFLAHHPGLAAFLLLVDWDGSEPLQVEGATILGGHDLDIPGFDYLALKYSASELCCAMKPFAIDHIFRHTRLRKIVYLDSDLWICAPFEKLLTLLDQHDFVVTPHTLAPPPNPERFWERPTLGDLAFAGPFNAGLFGVRATAEAKAFVDTWQDLVTRPGAFMPDLGGTLEQNSFNWVTSFVDRVHVLRDSAYNVAYWNLHDRSLRSVALDEPGRPEREDAFTVDGRPLVAFHFSGFSPTAPYRLSCFDQRYSLYILPSVARLVELYRQRLAANGSASDLKLPYRYDTFPSGIRIDAQIRRVFKEHETFLARELSPWTPEGESEYCEALLSPILYTASFLPALFDAIYIVRPDLQRCFPNARMEPDLMLQWIGTSGVYEYRYEELYDRYRPVLPSHHGAVLLTAAKRRRPDLFADLQSPLGADRHRLLGRLEEAGLQDLAKALHASELEHYYVSPLWLVRRIYEERPDVRQAFPDVLAADAPAFARWLTRHAVEDHWMPPHAADVFLAKAQGRSLARIFSFVNRHWHFMERWPLGFVGSGSNDFAMNLLSTLRNGMEYDADDVLVYLWTMDLAPWSGLALTLELTRNACQTPSPLLEEGQEELLKPLLERDPRFRAALTSYRQNRPDRDRGLGDQIRCSARPRESGITVFDALERALAAAPPEEAQNPWPAPESAGINLFGYHKSPIGLGSLTRGLHRALRSAGVSVRPNLLGNFAMDADLSPEDFLGTFDPHLDTNLFVSYPHLHEMLLEMYPEHVTRPRRNIAYLAWEQRDGSPYWPEVYKDFAQIWALSDFAAASLRRFMGREVKTVPCVLDFDAFPAPGTKEDFGLDPGKITFLYVFDANSSIERKNPEGVIRAFGAAFGPADDACLLLRISNAERLHHRERIKRILAAAKPGSDIRLLLEPMAHGDLMRLLSAVDCYVSLHRAEGFGYTCAEAMAYGQPVIATGYSGNLQFMTDENSFLTEYREISVEVGDGPFQRGSLWAEPDVDHAAHLMRTVYEERERARAVGVRGREDVRRLLSATSVGRIAAAALAED